MSTKTAYHTGGKNSPPRWGAAVPGSYCCARAEERNGATSSVVLGNGERLPQRGTAPQGSLSPVRPQSRLALVPGRRKQGRYFCFMTRSRFCSPGGGRGRHEDGDPRQRQRRGSPGGHVLRRHRPGSDRSNLNAEFQAFGESE